MIRFWLHLPACLVVWVLTGMPSHADDPPCAVSPAWTPCQLFPPGPSIADHSGTHDRDFFWILFNAYADEWNRMPPADPQAPPTRRSVREIPPVPMTSPPMPFTDWPIGGSQVIGASTPNSVDSPLMKALIGGTPIGKPLEDAHIQIYGWVDAGGILRVGPRSAGADPGPICYGRGGRRTGPRR